ncbi:MAG: hypothetical protein WCE51_10335 [Chthoniobacterales bacterium]
MGSIPQLRALGYQIREVRHTDKYGCRTGWNPTVSFDHAILAVDDGAEGSVYKGAALGESSSGLRLFVTNFHEAGFAAFTAEAGRAALADDGGAKPVVDVNSVA